MNQDTPKNSEIEVCDNCNEISFEKNYLTQIVDTKGFNGHFCKQCLTDLMEGKLDVKKLKQKQK